MSHRSTEISPRFLVELAFSVRILRRLLERFAEPLPMRTIAVSELSIVEVTRSFGE